MPPGPTPAERHQERLLQESFIDDATADLRFTHVVVINFDRNIRWNGRWIPGIAPSLEPRSTLAEFLKRFDFALKRKGSGMPAKRIRTQDPVDRPRLYAVVEDHTRDCLPTARHLHCLVQCPELDVRQLEVRHEVEKHAKALFDAQLTNFHISRLPRAPEARRPPVAYCFKHVARDFPGLELDAMERVWTTADFMV